MLHESSGPRREIELDFIRGVAILLVLVFHYHSRNRLFSSPFMDRVQSAGWVGVDVFFVLSGLLVGGLMMKEWNATSRLNALRFLKRRAFKIWPSYYALVLTAAAFHMRPLKSFFWQNLFNVQNYFPSSLYHTWSLAVEEHFYLLLSVVMSVAVSKKWRPRDLLFGFAVAALLIELLRALLVISHHGFFFYTHTRIDALILGVMLAILKGFYPEVFDALRRQRKLLLVVVCFAAVVLYRNTDAAVPPHQMGSPYLITIVDYASVALVLLLYRARTKHRMPYRLVARVGVCSYGIYLWHVSVERPVDALVLRLPSVWGGMTSTFLPYVLAIALGFLSTKAIDLPFLRLRERLVPAQVPEPPVPVV